MINSIPQIAIELRMGEQKVRRYIKRFPDHFHPEIVNGVNKYTDLDQKKLKRICELYNQKVSRAEVDRILRDEYPIDIMPAEPEEPIVGKIELGPESLKVIGRLQASMQNLADAIGGSGNTAPL